MGELFEVNETPNTKSLLNSRYYQSFISSSNFYYTLVFYYKVDFGTIFILFIGHLISFGKQVWYYLNYNGPHSLNPYWHFYVSF